MRLITRPIEAVKLEAEHFLNATARVQLFGSHADDSRRNVGRV